MKTILVILSGLFMVCALPIYSANKIIDTENSPKGIYSAKNFVPRLFPMRYDFIRIKKNFLLVKKILSKKTGSA
jgi:hypothetical protein